MPKILLAAPHSGSGKTTVTIGLLRALVARGLRVQPFKVGPDYIDTAYHSHICGLSAVNLDAYLLGEANLRSLFAEYEADDENGICVIEGVMGLYDGLGSGSEASSAHVARLVGAPVVLVMDAKGMAATAAALVQGLACFGPADIRGVIFNNISGERHYRLLKENVEENTGIRCLGFLPRDESLRIHSRHLGILPQAELEGAERLFGRAQELTQAHVDIDGLLEIARQAPPITAQVLQLDFFRPCKIAVAMDKAFSFYYADNLRLLEKAGAELIFFSPMHDECLPECDGAYIGGGFPEVFAQRLEENAGMRESIRGAVQAELPLYAECGGYMYLTEAIITKEGERYEMCGVFAGQAEQGRCLNGRFGYIQSRLLQDTLIGAAGFTYRNHEFHHSRIKSAEPAYEARKESSGAVWRCGAVSRNAFGTYAHAYFRTDLRMVARFLEICCAWRDRRTSKNT